MTRPLFAAAALLLAGAPLPAAEPQPRFVDEIKVFAVEDESDPPPQCATLFVGSSSFRFWFGLSRAFPFPTVRRGFGGATIADVNAWFDRIVAPYRPRRIVFYAGENDIDAGAQPEAVLGDFKQFLARKDAALGATPVYFITAKPSPARFAEFDRQTAFNGAVAALATQRRDLRVIDVVTPMLANRQPRPELFISDHLHMKRAGYAIWQRAISAALARPAPSRAPGCGRE